MTGSNENVISLIPKLANQLKILPSLILLCTLNCLGQSYVDIAKLGYGHTFNNRFEGSDSSTRVGVLEADITFPVVIHSKHALVTGVLFNRNELQLFPEGPFTGLYSTALKLGLSSSWNERWSSNIVLLPKWASDYDGIRSDDFFFGGYAAVKYQKHERLIYRFGAYASTEAFGVFSTPFLGWYYTSRNGQFEMDCSLPISADLNYDTGKLTYGIDYFGIGRSFNINGYQPTGVPAYVDLSSLEFSAYLQFEALEETVLIRAKLGYASNDFEVYQQDDTIDLGLSAFSFGDNRQQLNPSISGGFFAKLEAIYRFQLRSTPKEQP